MIIRSTEIVLDLYRFYPFLVHFLEGFFFFFLNLSATERHPEIIAIKESKIRTMYTVKIKLLISFP